MHVKARHAPSSHGPCAPPDTHPAHDMAPHKIIKLSSNSNRHRWHLDRVPQAHSAIPGPAHQVGGVRLGHTHTDIDQIGGEMRSTHDMMTDTITDVITDMITVRLPFPLWLTLPPPPKPSPPPEALPGRRSAGSPWPPPPRHARDPAESVEHRQIARERMRMITSSSIINHRAPPHAIHV